MGSSSKKTTTNQTTSGVTNATTTPNVPSFASDPVQGYYSLLEGFIDRKAHDPNYLATPANYFQQKAANNAANLPTGSAELGMSSSLATQAGRAPAQTYNAPTIDAITKASAPGLSFASLGPAAQAGSASLLDNFSAYANPVTDELVTKNLAAYDDAAGRNTAAANNALARTGAFGGSRAAIAQSQLASDQAMGRGLLSSQLRSDAFNQQAGLANADAGRRQETGLFNTNQTNQQAQYGAGLENAARIAQMQEAAATERANAAAANQRAAQQAGFDAQAGMFNVGTQQDQLDRMLAAGGLLSSNAATGSGIANNNVATQMGVGNSLYDIDRFNNSAELLGLGGIQGLLGGYEPFIGQNVYATENGKLSGTSTEKSSGGLLGSLGGLLSIVPGVGSAAKTVGKLF